MTIEEGAPQAKKIAPFQIPAGGTVGQFEEVARASRPSITRKMRVPQPKWPTTRLAHSQNELELNRNSRAGSS